MIRTIILGDRTISYDLQRKTVKNLNLRIKADQSVFVSANTSVSIDAIEDFLRSKSDYILGALNKYAEQSKYAPTPKSFVDGESFEILGRELRLKVVESKKNSVDSDGTFITLTIKSGADWSEREKIMNRWLKHQCQTIVTSVCEAVYPKFKKYGVDFPEIRMRNMVSRWGSCQPKRKILTFNIALIQAPVSCIEYVVVHEFTHFLHPNHSRAFYDTMAMFMPNWKERKKELERSRFFVE